MQISQMQMGNWKQWKWRSSIYWFLFHNRPPVAKKQNFLQAMTALIGENVKIGKVFVERWSLNRGGLCYKYALVICHLWDIIIMWSLNRGRLCTKVVSVLSHLWDIIIMWSLYRSGP